MPSFAAELQGDGVVKHEILLSSTIDASMGLGFSSMTQAIW